MNIIERLLGNALLQRAQAEGERLAGAGGGPDSLPLPLRAAIGTINPLGVPLRLKAALDQDTTAARTLSGALDMGVGGYLGAVADLQHRLDPAMPGREALPQKYQRAQHAYGATNSDVFDRLYAANEAAARGNEFGQGIQNAITDPANLLGPAAKLARAAQLAELAKLLNFADEAQNVPVQLAGKGIAAGDRVLLGGAGARGIQHTAQAVRQLQARLLLRQVADAVIPAAPLTLPDRLPDPALPLAPTRAQFNAAAKKVGLPQVANVTDEASPLVPSRTPNLLQLARNGPGVVETGRLGLPLVPDATDLRVALSAQGLPPLTRLIDPDSPLVPEQVPHLLRLARDAQRNTPAPRAPRVEPPALPETLRREPSFKYGPPTNLQEAAQRLGITARPSQAPNRVQDLLDAARGMVKPLDTPPTPTSPLSASTGTLDDLRALLNGPWSTSQYVPEANGIAKRLGVPVEQAQQWVDALIADGTLTRTPLGDLAFTPGVQNTATSLPTPGVHPDLQRAMQDVNPADVPAGALTAADEAAARGGGLTDYHPPFMPRAIDTAAQGAVPTLPVADLATLTPQEVETLTALAYGGVPQAVANAVKQYPDPVERAAHALDKIQGDTAKVQWLGRNAPDLAQKVAQGVDTAALPDVVPPTASKPLTAAQANADLFGDEPVKPRTGKGLLPKGEQSPQFTRLSTLGSTPEAIITSGGKEYAVPFEFGQSKAEALAAIQAKIDDLAANPGRARTIAEIPYTDNSAGLSRSGRGGKSAADRYGVGTALTGNLAAPPVLTEQEIRTALAPKPAAGDIAAGGGGGGGLGLLPYGGGPSPRLKSPAALGERKPWEMTLDEFIGTDHTPGGGANDYTQAYLQSYKKGKPGIAVSGDPVAARGELVLRNQQGKPVGVLAAERGVITDIAVSPDARRQGVGSLLLDAALAKGITGVRGPFSKAGGALIHGRLVQQAILDGEAVPAAVLRDYPKLAAMKVNPAAADAGLGSLPYPGGLTGPIGRAVLPAAGAGAGAGIGYLTGDNPEDARTNALKGAAIGGAIGGGLEYAPDLAAAAGRIVAPGSTWRSLGDAAARNARTEQSAANALSLTRPPVPVGLRDWFSLWKRQVVETPRNWLQDESWGRIVMRLLQPGATPELGALRKDAARYLTGTNDWDKLPVTTRGLLSDLGQTNYVPQLGESLSQDLRHGKQLSTVQQATGGAALSLLNPVGAATSVLGVGAAGATGAARPALSAVFRTINDFQHSTFRLAAFNDELTNLVGGGAEDFLARLSRQGVNVSSLPTSGAFSPAQVGALAGATAERQWAAITKRAVTLAEERVKFLFGDYAQKNLPERLLGGAIPFMSWVTRAYPVAVRMALDHPVLALAVFQYFRATSQGAGKDGRPGYTTGMVPIPTKTPFVGPVLAALVPGNKGVVYVDPVGAFSPVGADLFFGNGEDATDPNKTWYQRATATLSRLGLPGPNPLVQAGAYVTGLDYKTPGALSRTAGLEQGLALLPGNPQLPNVGANLLAGARSKVSPAIGPALGGKSDPYAAAYDPISRRYGELVYERTGHTLQDPVNAAYLIAMTDPENPLLQQARRDVLLSGAAKNAVSLVNPTQLVTQGQTPKDYRAAQNTMPFSDERIATAVPALAAAMQDANAHHRANQPVTGIYQGTKPYQREDLLQAQWADQPDVQFIQRVMPKSYALQKKTQALELWAYDNRALKRSNPVEYQRQYTKKVKELGLD